jgi:hypothetical protein
MSIFRGRDCPSILCWWSDSTTTEAHATQALTSSHLPMSWPLGSRCTGAPSLRPATLVLHIQPIYFEWMGLSGRGGIHLLKRWGFSCLLLLLVFLEALYGRQFSWWIGYLLFRLSFFWFFLVDSYTVQCLSFASFA